MTVLVRWARRRLAVVVLTCLLVTVITVLVAPSGSSSYTAETRLTVATGASNRGPGQGNEAITQAQNFAGFIPNSDVVLSSVTGMSQQQVADRLKVTADGIQVIIAFTTDDARSAQAGASDIANTLADGLPGVFTRGTLDRTRTASQLTITESHPTSTATLLLLGLGLGLVLGVVLAVAWDRRDRRIDEPEDLSRVLDTTVTSLTTLSEWQARGLRQRWLSADPDNDGVVALVSCRSHLSDPLPWLYAEFGEVAGAAGLRLTRTTDRLVKNLAAIRTLSGPTLLFAGAVGTEGAVAATLVADVTVLAVTEGTPARDVLDCRRLLTQQGVAPCWALIVPRGAARAAERAEQRLVRSSRPRPGDGRQVPPISALEPVESATPAAPVAPVAPVADTPAASPATPPNGAAPVNGAAPKTPAHREQAPREPIVLEPPAVLPVTDASADDTAFSKPVLSGPAAPGAAADSRLDDDLEQLLSAGEQPARRSGRSVTRRSRLRAR